MKADWSAWWMGALLLLGAGGAWAEQGARPRAERVEALAVSVVDDQGRAFAQYPLSARPSEGAGLVRAYVEAENGRNYAVRVHNGTGRRIGVVIAVDGRNIISGRRSDLGSDERMYILEPGQGATYEGWRTGRDRVNRFYFTAEGDSYAGAFGDYSAMGVIAVAAFREREPVRPWWRPGADEGAAQARPGAPPARAGTAPGTQAEPGTGYGERHWSPSRPVDFNPEPQPFERVFLKYAWRSTLCRQGIIDCGPPNRPPRPNRFWDQDQGYAPPPPGRGAPPR